MPRPTSRRDETLPDEGESVQVAVFQPVLSHYRVDFFNELDRQTGGGVTLQTVDASDASLLGGAEHRLTVSRAAARTYRRGPLWFVPRALAVVWDRRWDVVVLSWNARQVEILPALLLARARGVPVILWGHGFGSRGSRSSAWLRRRQVGLAAAIITYNEPGADEVRAQVPDARVRVVSNTAARPAPSDADALTEPRYRVAFLGRLLAHKLGEHLLEAVGHLRSCGLDLTVDVIGDGPHREAMEMAAKCSGVDDRIIWHGQVIPWDDVRQILRGCDLVVLPSSAGLAVVDAFAAGRGAVVLNDPTRNSPEADFVIDGVTGFRYGPDSPAALAARLASIYADPDSLCRVSVGAIDHYRRKLTVEVAAETFRDVIGEVVGAPSAGRTRISIDRE